MKIITFHVMMKRDEEQIASVTIRNEMLTVWGVDQKTLYADAMMNSASILPVKICSLSEELGPIFRAAFLAIKKSPKSES